LLAETEHAATAAGASHSTTLADPAAAITSTRARCERLPINTPRSTESAPSYTAPTHAIAESIDH
jgi:hypothetical protein